ncbi:hypothetical protein E2C01_046689 [Portunus trituberculatus]|uniref:Uncharacterized protein n=1 Tax=Portunus trituberculatus TaxID=210409 RepID=A0A5B7FZ82_PORTR|nr:hypothetical protein [Portunus trituberculatus]
MRHSRCTEAPRGTRERQVKSISDEVMGMPGRNPGHEFEGFDLAIVMTVHQWADTHLAILRAGQCLVQPPKLDSQNR